MTMTLDEWTQYRDILKKINEKAADEFRDAVWNINGKFGGVGLGKIPREELIDYGYALITKYGEASAAWACEMYDEVARASNVVVPSAVPAETASREEVGKALNGAIKRSQNENYVSSVVSRLVKRAGQDTTLKNAQRDGAQFAWVPAGDTCVFCLTLASRGWQYVSKKALKNGHAEHIHANCDCAYAVRFDNKSNVAGYDPDKYKEMYDNAEGDNSKEKINSMRRKYYAENKDKINAQKRAAYREKALNNQNDDGTIRLRINYFPKDDALYLESFSIEEIDGFEDICGHGNEDQFEANYNGEKHVLNAKEFAKRLVESGQFNGQDFRLAACSTGKGTNSFAQQLSKELHNKVLAPDEDVFYAPDEGAIFVGSPYSNTGNWRLFNNGVEEEWKN